MSKEASINVPGRGRTQVSDSQSSADKRCCCYQFYSCYELTEDRLNYYMVENILAEYFYKQPIPDIG